MIPGTEKNNWRPTADIADLKFRANILANIRDFFAQKNIFEVETPLMCSAPVTDPFLDALTIQYHHKTWYMQTSPEYAMKRLLCAGSGSIYQMCKAFRSDEMGKYHHPEFTMLEWYHIGFNHHDLMLEMDEFLQYVIQTKPARTLSYQQLFEKYLNINPHIISDTELNIIAQEKCNIQDDKKLDRDDYLNLLLTHVIEPELKSELNPIFIYDYPASQCALAKIRQGTSSVAERFEVYFQGIELANGYHELTQSSEQKKRFNQDLEKREKLTYPIVPIDHYLLSAMENGLPDCAGVALGVDRLVMIAAQKQNISDIMAFNHGCI